MIDAILFGVCIGMVCTVPIAILLHFVWLAMRIDKPNDEYYEDFP